jgi:PPP family 3-phenylpropionic acid transporter
MRAGRPAGPERTSFARIGSVYYLVAFLGSGAFFPFLYVHFADLGLNGKQIGLLATLSPIVTLLVTTPVASLADRTRKRVRIAQAGLALTGTTVFSLRFAASFAVIVPLMVGLAVFSTPVSSIVEGLIARMAQRHRLNFGGMRLWGSLGYAVSALGCGALWQAFGFGPMFLVAALTYVPLIVIARWLEEGPVIPPQERRPALDLLRDRGLLVLLLAAFLSAISNSLAMTWSGVYARWLGGGNMLVGAMVAVSALAELPTMFFSDRISLRIGSMKAAVGSYALMAGAFLGYALSREPSLLLVFAVIKGLGYGVWMTVTIRLVIRRTPEQWASTAQALLTMCLWGLAPLLAGPLGGLIHDAFTPAAVFVMAAITLVMAGGVILCGGRRLKLE